MEILENLSAPEDEQTRYLIQIARAEHPQEVAVPLARITTCGHLAIAVLQSVHPGEGGCLEAAYGSPDAALLAKKGTSTAFILLALLVSQPGCFATKDWLSEKLGHLRDVESEEGEEDAEASEGLKRVDNVVSRLRHLLSPAQPNEPSEVKLVRRRLVEYQRASGESGSGYRLAGLPLVWLDVEEIDAHTQRARRLEQFGTDGLSEWQAAYDLAMGGRFLPGEAYSDWAEWRRQAIETHLWDCVQVLWHRFVEQGVAGETEALRILRDYWQRHVTNEDALRPLLELLGKREWYGQAKAYYEQLCTALDLEGKQPDQRTQDIMDFQQAVQIQRTRGVGNKEKGGTGIFPAPVVLANQQYDRPPTFAYTSPQNSMKAVGGPEKENNQTMDPLRRATVAGLLSLIGGVTTPSEWWERLVSPHVSAMNAETFLHIQKLLETGWGLSNAGELHLAEHVLVSFLPRMLQIAPYRREAASLAAEGLRLRGILAAHQQRLQDKLAVCLQAVEYARQASNPDILIAQLTELAIAFIYARQPGNAFRTYQEALSYCEKEHLSPLVRSRIYAAAAPTFAKHGESGKACSFIEQAYESFPTQLESEPSAFAADNQLFMVDYYQGLLYLVMDQPEAAYTTFERTLTRPWESGIPERWRLIILNYQGLASIFSNQLEQYAVCLEEGISGSLALGSQKRLDEAISIFQQCFPHTWSTEPKIKRITERFHLERESRRAEELEI